MCQLQWIGESIGLVGSYPHIILRPRDEGSRDMNQGPESGSSNKNRVSQSGCFVNGSGRRI